MKKRFGIIFVLSILLLMFLMVSCDVINGNTGTFTDSSETDTTDTETVNFTDNGETNDETETKTEPQTQYENDLTFADLQGKEFIFSSGVGAWRTILNIFPDGTFSGKFRDSDMGDVGDDYPNGTAYVCNFSGNFKSPVKTGDYEYLLVCESVKQEGTQGDEKIINDVKTITSFPYGFETDESDEFILYLPGKKISELPDGFLDWVGSYMDFEGQDTINFYGLYNTENGHTFVYDGKYADDDDNIDENNDNYDYNNNYDISEKFLADEIYYSIDNPANSIIFAQGGTFVIVKDEDSATGDYILDGEIIYVRFHESDVDNDGYDSYFTINDKYNLTEMHGETYSSIAGVYASSGFHLVVSHLDEYGFDYVFYMATTTQYTEMVSGYASVTEDLHSIWAYKDDENGLTFTFYNDAHAVNVTAEPNSPWEQNGLTDYYEKAKN